MVESVHLVRVDDGVIVYTNPRFDSVFGYDPGELVGKHVSIINAPGGKTPEDVANEIIKSLKQAGVWEGEVHNIRKDGISFWCHADVSTFKHPQYGEVWISVHRDITERKQAEEALKEMEAQYRNLFENANEAIFVAQDGWLVFLNPMSTMMIGYSGKELMAKPFTEFIHPDDREMVINRHSRRMKGVEIPFPYSFQIIHKDGNSKWVEVNAVLINWKGKPATLNFLSDITERKQAEKALRVSEERFRLLSEAAFEAIAIHEEGVLLNANDQYFKMFGYEPGEALGKEMISMTIAPEAIEFAKKQIATDGLGPYEFIGLRKDGTRFPAEANVRKMEYKGRNVRFGAIRDITERKQAEEIIKASLQEKDILLREIHHRVKNNLQVISGLLDLQAMSVGNPELMERLNESQSRIQAMAMVHEKLYSSKDFSRIDLADYVRTLSKDLFKSYKINPGKIDLIIQTDGVVYVDINKAIPCGLILNELISNALKHAFPGDRHGELQVLMGETKNAEIEIIIRDNGLGLPDDVDIHQPQTLGLDLVNGLIKNQLDGQIEVRRDNGTEFRIKFPL
jgi:PAS domain S-box-containing protein